MSTATAPPPEPSASAAPPKMASSSSSSSASVFPPIPGPLQRLFDLVPLITYPANALPGDDACGLDDSTEISPLDLLPTLYVFIDPADAAQGRASFNPTCLKWQTFLRFADIPVRVVSSSNHASPTGALPFLQPARRRPSTQPKTSRTTTIEPPLRPIPAHDFPTFVKKAAAECQSSSPNSSPIVIPSTLRDHPRAPAYQSLLDTSLRRAWLHAVYLDEAPESKTGSIATRLYARAASTSYLVRSALSNQLRAAAAAEVWGSGQDSKDTPGATAQIYRDAEAALLALSTILERSETDYFFGSAEPTLFDAAVFSYTHLLLEESGGDGNANQPTRFPWNNTVLPDMVRGHPQLVQHRDRIVARFWKAGSGGVSDSVIWVKV
ncbi:hypothetical protein SEUCBS139899_001683 [Sporothrix eucalyptigena]|uniref:Mitochondrial outer membrane protein n=1 Tax=Sporothrix eucalyptigena TaxID=1812306 RepID=A0ABP0ASQ5_9PEZI